MRKKLISIVLSIMVAVTFMPLAAECSFAVEASGSQPTAKTAQTATQFNSASKVSGIHVAGYTYNSVKLAWNAVDHADGYKVFRATKKKGKYTLVKTVSSPVFNDTKNNSLYKYKYYKICAYGKYNGKTVQGPNSDIFKTRPVMPAPTGLSVICGTELVKVSWNKVAGARKYQVYCSTSKYGTYSKLTTTKKCYCYKSAASGTRYYFKVKTLRGKKKSGYSAIVEGLLKLAPPTGLKAVQENQSIRVSWNAVPQAYSYQVYRAETAKGEYKFISGVKGTSFADTKGLESGKTYYYKVRARAYANGIAQEGEFASTEGASREMVINLAKSYKGIKEKSAKHKDIVDTFNSKGNGRIGYGDPWCAAFVSAIEIKAGYTSLVPLYSYCPTMLNKFRSKTYDKSYKPKTADVVFFDWNWNKVPDHVGFVDNYNSYTNKITTIEGNYSDTVKCRTFKPGYSLLLAYGLPAYPESAGVSYQVAAAPEAKICAIDESVSDADVQEAVAEVMSPEPAEEASEEAAEVPETDYEKVVALADYVQEEQPAADVNVEESTYDAFLMQEACDEMGIETCVVTTIDANGNLTSYNEIMIDGQIYILDASEGSIPEKFVPEEIN